MILQPTEVVGDNAQNTSIIDAQANFDLVIEHRRGDDEETKDLAKNSQRRGTLFNMFDPKDLVVGEAGGQKLFGQDNGNGDKSLEFTNEETGAIVEPILNKQATGKFMDQQQDEIHAATEKDEQAELLAAVREDLKDSADSGSRMGMS